MAGGTADSRWSRLWLLLKRYTLYGSGTVVVSLLIVVIMAVPLWQKIRTETIEMLDQHIHHEVSHPGWSFPGVIWSASVPMTLSTENLIEHAVIRNYEARCPAIEPGQYCEESKKVVPRGGLFPEGQQPDQNGNWTITPALEPVEIAPLMGKDAEWRLHLPYNNAPEILIKALLASEDAEYYEHNGVNFRALFRAAVANLQGGHYQQGASTLSMQLYRNLSQRTEKNIRRKIIEMAAAITLDTYLGKKGVIQMYLNTPYLGQNGSISVCGFEAAAQYYFSIPAKDLSMAQAATLVGILPAPGRFRPDKYPERAKQRRDMVLKRLKEVYAIDVEEALDAPMALNMGTLPETKYPAYVQATRQWLNGHLSEQTVYSTGLNVFTGLDLIQQERTKSTIEIEKGYLRTLSGLPNEPTLEAAAVLIDIESGYLSAVYGGTIAEATDFSRATQARRQAGSSFKPLVYALALEQLDEQEKPQWTTFDTLPNERRTFPDTNGWRPRNNGGKYSESTTLSRAMAISQNVATASLLEKLGGALPLIEFAEVLGFNTLDFPEEMGLALGQAEVTPLEMARMTAIVANGGYWVTGQPVQSAIDINGKNHIEDTARGERVISQYTATLTRELMRLVITAGTGGASRGSLGKKGYYGPAIGKTGTTDKHKDLWFVGASPYYSSALWLGYDVPENLHASASDFAAPIWGWWMRKVHSGYDRDKEFEGLDFRRAGVCSETGKYGNESCKLVAASLVKGQRISESCEMEHPLEDPEKKHKSLWERKELVP